MSELYATRAELLQMLESLVNIDSGSYDKEGVDTVGNMLRRAYEELGFEIETHKNKELGNNLILRHAEATDPKVLIVAHMDTVFARGTAAERPFIATKEYAYGPGVIDMKASHVLLYFALKTLYEAGDNSYRNVELVFNCDEEIGSISSQTLIEEKARGKKYALVMEPARANGSFVSARRGSGDYVLEVQGQASHAGMAPKEGISAIEDLARKIIKLHDLTDDDQGITVNVGLIEGGASVNTIAPSAKAWINTRIRKSEQAEWLDQEVRAICNQTDVQGARPFLSGGTNRLPMEFNEGSQALAKIILEEAKSPGLDIDIGHVTSGGGSDASFTAGVGTPTIDGLGPVGGKQHTDEEYLVIDSLAERTQLFINLLARLGTENP